MYRSQCLLDRIIHADDSVTEFEYDCNGNLAMEWDANHPSASQQNPPTRVFVYASVASLLCAGGLGLLGVAAGADGQTSTGLLYALAGALLSLRPPPTIEVSGIAPEA